jgi:DinB superfamily
MAAPSSSSPRWPDRLLAALDANDRQAIDVARGLSADEINWKPEPQAWSIGQCLDHLYVSNKVYLPPIARALEGRSPSPVDDIQPGWFGRWFIRTYIDPDTQRRKAQAPQKSRPAPRIDPSVLDSFLRSNDDVRTLIRRASAYDVNRIRFVNPFVPVIRFTVGTGFEVTCRHERRHLLQAGRVKQRMSSL